MIRSSIRTSTFGKWSLLLVALLIVPQIAFGQNQKKASTTHPPKTGQAVAPKQQPKPNPPAVKQPAQTAPQHADARPDHNSTSAGRSSAGGDAAGSQQQKQDKQVTPPRGTKRVTKKEGGPRDHTDFPGGDKRRLKRTDGNPGRVIKTSNGTTATLDAHNKMTSLKFKSPKGDDTKISYGAGHSRTVVSEHVNARGEHITVVNTGVGSGYVDRTFTQNGRPFMERTDVVDGHIHSVVYRGDFYRGRVYYAYVPEHFYARAFYGWAYRPWSKPIAWGWGWRGTAWYGYYGYYFAPYPYYAGPAFWLTDYVVAENLQAAYAEGVGYAIENDANAAPITVPANQAWTQTGTFVNAGDVIKISASGVISIGAGWPPMAPSGGAPNCGARGGFPAGQLPCWSLIGKIGDGPIFEVGNGRTLRVPNSGELLLGVNDDILGDNGGNWVATIRVPSSTATNESPASTDDGGTQSAALTAESKAAIAEEVKAQLAAEQDVSAAPAASTRQGGDQVPAALDPNQRTFIVSAALAETTADGEQCSLSPGDILTRIGDTPDGRQNVQALVSNSQKNDCAAGTTLAVSIQDLQDMHNDFVQKMDAGLQELADNQGKNGMPTSPAAGRRANPEGTADDNPTAAAELKQQERAADNAEQDVNQATKTGQGD